MVSRQEVAALLTLDECIAAITEAFRLRGEGKLRPPGILGIAAPSGAFHIKAAVMRNFFAAKVNGNFTDNPTRLGLPAIQGVIVLCDAETGRPLAAMDSIEITTLRTAAATALAARHLARPGSSVVTVCGCGAQGRAQLRAVASTFPLRRAFLWDLDPTRAHLMADELGPQVRVEVSPTEDLAAAVSQSAICITCTPSRKAFLTREWVRPGTFIAAVGTDSADKQELEPSILSCAKVVADVVDQCAEIGELHHAIAARAMTREQVYAELSELAAGLKPGRTSEDEITVFDSTGTALQDVAAAAAVYEKAARVGSGVRIEL